METSLVLSTSMPDIGPVIDEAELSFRDAWSILLKMKSAQTGGLLADDLYRFQPLLARSLFRLDECYRKVAAYRKFLLRKRTRLLNLRAELEGAERAKLALRESMDLARSLGDAFAWFFYAKSPELLEGHFKHQPIASTPPGIGAFVEFIFVELARSDSHFILYHGITTFLRIGDVSFVQIGDLKVTAIAEIKTAIKTTETAQVSVTIIGIKTAKTPRIFIQEQDKPRELNEEARRSIGRKRKNQALIDERLERQSSEMMHALRGITPDFKREVYDAYCASDLNRLIPDLRINGGSSIKVGKGLIVVALRTSNCARLSDRLLITAAKDDILAPIKDDLPAKALEIVDRTTTNNSIEVDEIGTKTRLGFLPLFWWNISTELLAEVYFRETMIISLYNPVHLLNGLKALGFSVRELPGQQRPEYEITKIRDKFIHRLENFRIFKSLVSIQLMKEAVVLETINRVADQDVQQEAKIAIHMVHQMQM